MLSTMTIWLLVSAGFYGEHGTQVVERFATGEECQRVLLLIREATTRPATLRCIRAAVLNQ